MGSPPSMFQRSSTPYPCAPSSSSSARLVAKTATIIVGAALVLCPSYVHGEGLRGSNSAQNEQYQPLIEHQERDLSSDREFLANDVMTNWAMTKLESPSSSLSSLAQKNSNEHGEEVAINQFRTSLLATDFPYKLKYETENELSGAVSLHVASYLKNTVDKRLLNLGLSCTKHEEQIGPELRWVLQCEGAAIFDETASEVRTRSASGATHVSEAIHQAFAGPAKSDFLEKLYPGYEIIRERRAWGVERANRSGRRRKKKESTTKKKKREKKRKKNALKKKKKKSQKRQQQQQMKPNSEVGQHQKSNSDEPNLLGYRTCPSCWNRRLDAYVDSYWKALKRGKWYSTQHTNSHG